MKTLKTNHWRIQEFERGAYGELGARAYNEGLGAFFPVGSRGKAPGQGVWGAKPPEAERIFIING